MPSARRTKLYILVAVVAILSITLYYRIDPFGGESPYLKTLKSLRAQEQAQAEAEKAEMAAGLKEAEEAAKEAAQKKAGPKPDPPRVVEDTMRDRLGTDDNDSERKPKVEVQVPEEHAAHKADHVGEELPMAGFDAAEEIATILKKHTIVIFSKSYCPYSKKAKDILLEKYKITPPPYVVELDQHLRGKELQEELAKVTGRRTVPNVLIAGTPIGGGDDIAKLDREDELANTIHKYGRKRIIHIFKLKED